MNGSVGEAGGKEINAEINVDVFHHVGLIKLIQIPPLPFSLSLSLSLCLFLRGLIKG